MTHYNKHRAYRRRRNPSLVEVGAELTCPACMARFVKRHGRQKFCSNSCRNHASYARRRAVLGKTPSEARIARRELARQEAEGDEQAFLADVAEQVAAVRAGWTEAERLKRIVDPERIGGMA